MLKKESYLLEAINEYLKLKQINFFRDTTFLHPQIAIYSFVWIPQFCTILLQCILYKYTYYEDEDEDEDNDDNNDNGDCNKEIKKEEEKVFIKI